MKQLKSSVIPMSWWVPVQSVKSAGVFLCLQLFQTKISNWLAYALEYVRVEVIMLLWADGRGVQESKFMLIVKRLITMCCLHFNKRRTIKCNEHFN